jgi:hypothetical protein
MGKPIEDLDLTGGTDQLCTSDKTDDTNRD